MNKTLLFVTFVFLISACQLSTDRYYYSKAQELEASGSYKKSIETLFRVIEVSENDELIISAAKKGAFLSKTFTKDYDTLLRFLRLLVLRSKDSKIREEAQFEIAEIYFSKLGDFAKAIEEYNRILNLDLNGEQRSSIRLNIVRSYYYLGQMEQAKLEIEDIEKRDFSEEFEFDLAFLKGNVLTGLNDLSEAIKVYQSLLEKFPEQAKKEQVEMNLAVCYEEKKDFDKAIEVLSNIEPTDDSQKQFIDLKIKRLTEIKGLQPGAKGYRK